MSNNKNQSEPNAELRRRAEQIIQIEAVEHPQSTDYEDTQKLLHELSVHQIELEMQNEALRQSQSETLEALGRIAESNEHLERGVIKNGSRHANCFFHPIDTCDGERRWRRSETYLSGCIIILNLRLRLSGWSMNWIGRGKVHRCLTTWKTGCERRKGK